MSPATRTQRTVSVLRCLFLSTLCLVMQASAAAQATFHRLGVLDDAPSGTFYSFSSGVSADGKVVTGFSGDAFHDWPFRWTFESDMELLGPLPPTSHVLSQAVSADGSVIVGGTLNEGPGVFRWTESTGLESLGAIGLAYAVSSNGDVIAGEADGRAFRWTEDTGFVSIGGQGAVARGISSDGSVVVGRTESGEAFRWTKESDVVGLGRLDPSGRSEAIAISADGSVIVGTSKLAEGGSLAFRWTKETGMVALETLPGMVVTEALDVSADGSLVVGMGARSPTNPRKRDAIIWNAEGKATRLIDVLADDFNLELSDSSLEVANGISADGNVIVGWGDSGGLAIEAWLVTLNVPEPSGTHGLCLGVLAAVALRRNGIRD